MDPMPDGYDNWVTSGPEEDEICGDSCECDKCNGEPVTDDADFEVNERLREVPKWPWPGA